MLIDNKVIGIGHSIHNVIFVTADVLHFTLSNGPCKEVTIVRILYGTTTRQASSLGDAEASERGEGSEWQEGVQGDESGGIHLRQDFQESSALGRCSNWQLEQSIT